MCYRRACILAHAVSLALPISHELFPGVGDLQGDFTFSLLVNGALAIGGEFGADPGGERFQLLDDFLDVVDQALRQGPGEVLPDDDAQHGDVFGVGRHGVRRNDPAVAAEHVGDLELGVAAVVF